MFSFEPVTADGGRRDGARSAGEDAGVPMARIYAKWRVVPGFAAMVDDAELERLRNDPNVISVEPDLSGRVTAGVPRATTFLTKQASPGSSPAAAASRRAASRRERRSSRPRRRI